MPKSFCSKKELPTVYNKSINDKKYNTCSCETSGGNESFLFVFQVTKVTHVDDDSSVKFSTETSFVVDKYVIE